MNEEWTTMEDIMARGNSFDDDAPPKYNWNKAVREERLPFVILTTYRPSKKTCKWIGRHLTKLTKEFGLIPFKNDEIKRNPKAGWSSYKLHAEVRRTAVAGSEAEGFHQDGDTSVSRAEMDFAMVCWANKTPTEVLYNGKVYQPKPYEVVIFKNLSCQHRRPQNCPNGRRMYRQRVQIPKHIKLP